MQTFTLRVVPFMDPNLAEIMRSGMTSYLYCLPVINTLCAMQPDCFDIKHPNIGPTVYNPYAENLQPCRPTPIEYHNVIYGQHMIGWENFFCGKLSKELETRQHFYETHRRLSRNPLTYSKDKPKSIMKYFFDKTLNDIHQAWLERCRECNNPTHGQKEMARHIEAVRETRELYCLSDHVQQQDKHLFHNDVETHIGQDTGVLKGWIRRWRKLVLVSVKRAADDAASTNELIYEYFGQSTKSRKTIKHPPKPVHYQLVTSEITNSFHCDDTMSHPWPQTTQYPQLDPPVHDFVKRRYSIYTLTN